jgi:hypothetical protein
MSPKIYTGPEVRALLHMPVRTFERLKADGALPFLEEVKPRLGVVARYRADLVDQYLAGQWGRPQLVFGRRSR